MIKRFETNGSLQSIEPAMTAFGYSYWSYMIPPFKPESLLILGVGEWTIFKLIRKVWGDQIRFTGIDIRRPYELCGWLWRDFIEGDAKIEIKKLEEKYDYIVVDISNGSEIPEWVFSEEFVKDLARITGKLLSINVLGKAKDMSFYDKYFDFDLEKTILDNKIYFYKAKDNKQTYFL